jgi:uncharacterized protein YfdQ (DUF2303 family)
MTNEDNNTAAAIEAGMLIGEPREITPGLAVVLKPQGAQIEQIDLRAFEAKYAESPLRKKGSRTLSTAAAFIAYVNAHKLPSTAIYSSKAGSSFEAVLNDHEPETREAKSAVLGDAMPQDVQEHAAAVEQAAAEQGSKFTLVRVEYDALGTPGWGDFTARYNCPLSVEWQRWNKHSQHAADTAGKRGMSQVDFMQFLEDNLLDIVKPASGALLQAVHSFEAKKDVAFKSATRLQDGSVTFAYTENVNEVAQDGKLSLPSEFTICIPVFDGGAKYEIDARLRYRVGGGGLTLWYELVRPHKVQEHAFNTVLAEVKDGVADVPVYDV